MGAGKHGGFGKTQGSQPFKSKHFTPVHYEGTVKVNGQVRDVSRRVYQRNDIDFNYYDARSGMTNLERMLEGSPPIGADGKPIILHHVIQKESGPMVEIREVTHKEYHKPLHGLIGKGNSFRNDPLLEKQYNNFRSAYWKWRAKEYKKGKRK
ncbi:MAG: HNH/ENDO VII family nuclease [Solobacterium sp.]|nr:HNH/ENDO VII family nuclease [Solobacterium sp.]